MRPITLDILLEVLASMEAPISAEELAKKHGYTVNRAKEVLHQMEEMGLVERREERYVRSGSGNVFLEACRKSDPSLLHEALMSYRPYRELYSLLSSGAYTIQEICEKLGINSVAVDVLMRLMRKTGARLAVDSKGRYYVERTSVDYEEFKRALVNAYASIASRNRLVRSYVAIPALRKVVAEELRISGEAFDKAFLRFIRENIGRVLLSPAPQVAKSDHGIRIGGVEYYYIYMG